MVWAIVGAIVGLYFGIRHMVNEHKEWEDTSITVLNGFLAFLFVALGCMVGFLIATVVGAFVPKHSVLIETTSMMAMKDQSTVSGSFFLGSGSIDGKWKYAFYTIGKDKSIKLQTVDVGEAMVFEDGEENPRVERYGKEFDEENWKYFAIGCDCANHYEFHVPKGSLTNQFKLDLE